MASELNWMAIGAAVEREERRRGRRGRRPVLLAFLAGALLAGVVAVASVRIAAALTAPAASAQVVPEVPSEWRWRPPGVETRHMFPTERARARLGRPGQ